MIESFLVICKQNFFEKITPANNLSRTKDGYIKAVAIAKKYLNNVVV